MLNFWQSFWVAYSAVFIILILVDQCVLPSLLQSDVSSKRKNLREWRDNGRLASSVGYLVPLLYLFYMYVRVGDAVDANWGYLAGAIMAVIMASSWRATRIYWSQKTIRAAGKLIKKRKKRG